MTTHQAEQHTTIPVPEEHAVTIEIDNAAEGRPISTDLWGVFFEDINYAADGGLYAELIQNGAFEYGPADSPDWTALTGWRVDDRIRVSSAEPVNAANPHYAELSTVDDALELVNDGFDGIALAGGASYRFSIHARLVKQASADTFDVELRDREGWTLAQAQIGPVGDDWSKHEVVLTPARRESRAQLVIRMPVNSSIAIDFVSLLPARTSAGTSAGTETALRPDLAGAIAALNPRFVRFPGGCVAHGLGLGNMYRWKDTIGPLEGRRQMFNLWGYHQSMGIGYLEYFRFCEQIGAKPLPVLAAGVCCQNTPGGPRPVPDERMADYIAEVLDLVEFANGSVQTRWGAVRAELGHPEPFGLEYLAIGNEDTQNDMFRDRFARIHDAIASAHPEITVIGTVGPSPFGRDYDEGWRFARERAVPIVDEHSYKSPRWLFENLGRYNSYDRGGPAVYVGEYGSKGNQMLNALAEAAYMMAMERNGDIVRLASYAPLLAKVDHAQWVPDLIYFDNEHVYPTLNYHVQRMHSAASGDRSLAVAVAGAPGFHRPIAPRSTFALRARDAEAIATRITLSGRAVDDVRLDPADGEVMLSAETRDGDYVLKLTVSFISGDDGFVVRFGALDTPDFFEWNFGTWRNRSLTLFGTSDGFADELTDQLPFSVVEGRDYDVEIRVTDFGRRIVCLLDGEIVHDVDSSQKSEQRFSAAAVRDTAAGTLSVKVVNAADAAVQAHLRFARAVDVRAVSQTTLTAPLTDGAPFQPAPASPVTKHLDGVPDRLLIPASSFVILAIDVAG